MVYVRKLQDKQTALISKVDKVKKIRFVKHFVVGNCFGKQSVLMMHPKVFIVNIFLIPSEKTSQDRLRHHEFL